MLLRLHSKPYTKESFEQTSKRRNNSALCQNHPPTHTHTHSLSLLLARLVAPHISPRPQKGRNTQSVEEEKPKKKKKRQWKQELSHLSCTTHRNNGEGVEGRWVAEISFSFSLEEHNTHTPSARGIKFFFLCFVCFQLCLISATVVVCCYCFLALAIAIALDCRLDKGFWFSNQENL